MQDFLNLLDEIEKCPVLYLGEKSLLKLEFFIMGYLFAEKEESVQMETYYFMKDFEDMVRDKYRITSTQSVYGIISFFSTSQNGAFDTFFELFHKFKDKRQENSPSV